MGLIAIWGLVRESRTSRAAVGTQLGAEGSEAVKHLGAGQLLGALIPKWAGGLLHILVTVVSQGRLYRV